MIPEIVSGLIGRSIEGDSATLQGYSRGLILRESYPGITPQPNSEVSGVLYKDLGSRDIDILNHYEGDLYLLTQVMVILTDGTLSEAHTYVLRNEYKHLLTGQAWDLETFKHQSQAAFLKDYKGFQP